MTDTTLTDFLLARITEDEAAAHYVEATWASVPSTARVLAECDAKRRIIALWVAADGRDYDPEEFYRAQGLKHALRALALPYASHPDYRQEWAL